MSEKIQNLETALKKLDSEVERLLSATGQLSPFLRGIISLIDRLRKQSMWTLIGVLGLIALAMYLIEGGEEPHE